MGTTGWAEGLCWVCVAVWGLSLVGRSGRYSLLRPIMVTSLDLGRVGSVVATRGLVVAHGPSCRSACGVFLDQGSNLCPLHWQADSYPLHHQGSPGEKGFKVA